MRNPELGAVLSSGHLIAPPHPSQHRMFALGKSRQQPAHRMMAEAKDRKADRRLCHADSPDG
jgi:hypothetical protein